jgi:hypothetical protein
MATGDDDADRFRVPRWISDDDSEDGNIAERPPTDGGETYVPRAETPSLSAGEPLWPAALPPPVARGRRKPAALPPVARGQREPAALPPPVSRGQREAAEPQRRGLIIVAAAAAVVVIVAVVLLVHGIGGDDKTPTSAAPAAPAPAQPSDNATKEAPTEAPTTTAPTTGRPTQDNGFGPLTIEAEAPGNTLTGSARVVDYPNASGGRVVRNIGEWELDAGPGTLRFNNVDVPRSGNYTLAFSYVDIDNEANRTAVIDISGRTGMVITVNGNDSCCRTQTVQVPLRKGRNTISFSNRTSHAPSIDKVVITAP